MENPNHGQVLGIPVGSVVYEAEGSMGRPAASSPEPARSYIQSNSYGSSQSKKNKVAAVINWMNKFSKKAENYTQGIREHVRLAPKISETFKGKLSLGARILQAGGVERVFRQLFCVGEDEKLLKASQCYLSTTAGPIAGLLFISNEKIAFHSERSLRFTSSKGDVTRIPYKVLIPLGKIKRANTSENANKPGQKYIQMVTKDDFEFWFMGFVSYQRSFKYVQQAVSQSTMNGPRRTDKFLLQ